MRKTHTFASAFENERCYKTVTKSERATKERVLWKDYNKQRSSSTRSRLLFHLILYNIGVMDKGVLGRTKPINFWRWYRMIFGGILNRDKTNFPSGKVIIKKLYNGEFDPGSGWTLATGLTHASRGVTSGRACSSRMTTGARVSNAYPTWPIPRDSPSKGGLIPYAVIKRHFLMTKGLAVWDGDASD